MGSIGVYFDPAYRQQSSAVAVPFAPFNFYVVAKGLQQPGVLDGIGAYECAVQPPAGSLVATHTLPGSYIDLGAGDDNWIVGTGGCRSFVDNGGDTYLLVTYSCLFLAAPGQNLPVRVTPAAPTSFTPAGPGFLVVNSGDAVWILRRTVGLP